MKVGGSKYGMDCKITQQIYGIFWFSHLQTKKCIPLYCDGKTAIIKSVKAQLVQ